MIRKEIRDAVYSALGSISGATLFKSPVYPTESYPAIFISSGSLSSEPDSMGASTNDYTVSVDIRVTGAPAGLDDALDVVVEQVRDKLALAAENLPEYVISEVRFEHEEGDPAIGAADMSIVFTYFTEE
jgi:hypothetical protein